MKINKSVLILSMNYSKVVDERIIDIRSLLERVIGKENEE